MRVDEIDGLERCYTNLRTPNLTAKPHLHKKNKKIEGEDEEVAENLIKAMFPCAPVQGSALQQIN